MNDPTNWNADAEVGSFAFATPEDADKAEAIMNKALRESFENGRNVALEEAALVVEGHYWDSLSHADIGKAHGEGIAKTIRALKIPTAAKESS